jgi:hypothetical protein
MELIIGILFCPQNIPVATPVQRKKSLPDVQTLPRHSEPMSREEASILSSMQRETVRRRIEDDEKMRQNPLLWLVSPHVKVCKQYINTSTIQEIFLAWSKI